MKTYIGISKDGYIISNDKKTYEVKHAKEKRYSGVTPNGAYIKEIIYNNPATIVFWSDGTKTVAKCSEGDIYVPESGLSICILKKILGATEVKKIFTEWHPIFSGFDSEVEQNVYPQQRVDLKVVRQRVSKKQGPYINKMYEKEGE